jgi:hypothetical protein
MTLRRSGGSRRCKKRCSVPLRVTIGALVALSMIRAPEAAIETPMTETADASVETPTSTEQGQTLIDESFGRLSNAELRRERRREAFRDTKFSAELRAMCMNSENLNGTQNEACALGGSAGLRTGYFEDLFAFGLTGYTSQRLYGPADKDGTLLLAPGQHGYTVLGEAYAAVPISERVQATVGLKSYETPYINSNDSRMTPNTFEAAVVQGSAGGGAEGAPAWRFGAGYVDKIKERDSDDFVSMATAAGAPAGVARGVSVAGANYTHGDLSIGGVDYYSNDIINIAYVEAKGTLSLTDRLRLRVALQYANQRSVGDELLAGHAFSANQEGIKVEFGYDGALVTTAYTNTSAGTTMYSPWGGYPGYTSVQIDNFDRGGENAWMLRAAYNLQVIKNLSCYALYVHGSAPDVAKQYAQAEYDLNVQWKAVEGALNGLMLRARFGHVVQASSGQPQTNQLRLILYYDPPGLKSTP